MTSAPKLHAVPSPQTTTDDDTSKPSGPRQWTIAKIETALSRTLPGSILKTKPRKNKKTGEVVHLPYVPWYKANKILSKYAPGWHGEVTNIQQIGEELVLTYRLTIPAADGDVTREATGSENVNCGSYGETAANAESQAFRRACARFGLGLYLYEK